jgi:4-carboxymuconolactone decarboxylase
MARVKLIQNKEDIAPEHSALFDELAALRGRISGPSTVVLHSPGLARPWNEISEYLHGLSVVQAQDAELAVSATAREYDCGYIWAAHAPQARKAGVAEDIVAAIRDGRPLPGDGSESVTVARFAQQLVRGNRVDSNVFAPLLQKHGPRWLVELTAWIGRYGALAAILNSFEVVPAPAAEPLPPVTRDAVPRPRPAPAGEPRVAPIVSREHLAEADTAVFDAVAEGRGSVRGPFSILMYSPPLCQRIFDVSNYLRFASQLTPRLRELATIATARAKDCPYVWAAHATAARREGVDDRTIDTVRGGGGLGGLAQGDADVVDFARQIYADHRVEQALFDRLRVAHGERWLVELTALIGHYGLVAGILNAFEVAPAVDTAKLD